MLGCRCFRSGCPCPMLLICTALCTGFLLMIAALPLRCWASMAVQTGVAPAALVAFLAISFQMQPLIEYVATVLLFLALCFALVFARYRPLAVSASSMAVTIASALHLLAELEW
jgi:hypothetical protein